MDFRYKCFLQQIFSNIPFGVRLNYLFQKNITKSLFSKERFFSKVNEAYEHYNKFCVYNKLENNSMRYYEFGAGWDLIIPISMSLLGLKVTCIDVRKLIFKKLIKDTIYNFYRYKGKLPFTYNIDLTGLRNPKDIEKTLCVNFKIEYIAPFDASNTKFPDNSIDFISSTSTFEHIPREDIIPILRESYRILKCGGVFSIIIDYKDHWSYFDKNISIYNFLQYTEREWRKYNPSLNYQNRMRHKDYIELINNSDFKIVEETIIKPDDKEKNALHKMNISSDFQQYNFDELQIKGSKIVLRK